jgi:hypothetical protein
MIAGNFRAEIYCRSRPGAASLVSHLVIVAPGEAVIYGSPGLDTSWKKVESLDFTDHADALEFASRWYTAMIATGAQVLTVMPGDPPV